MNCFDRLKKAFSSFTEKISNKLEEKKEEIKETERPSGPPQEPVVTSDTQVPEQDQTPKRETTELKPEQRIADQAVQNSENVQRREDRKFDLFGFIRYKEIKEEDVSDLIDELRFELLEDDVSLEVTEKILEDLKRNLVGKKVSRKENLEQLIHESLKKSLKDILKKNYIEKDVVETIKTSKKPFVVMFFGVNGVGKTTTIAKFAMLLKKSGLSVIIAASDTFRAAAQEQLAVHASKLEVPLVKGKYGGDPASVAFDAIQSAKSRGIDAVLIDTAGRMHTDKDLVEELRRLVRIAKPNLKVLVLDSLAGNDALKQAEYFEKAVGYDFVILTKVDADAKGGIALSLAYELGKPVMYLGMGQDYDSLVKFNPDWFTERLLS
ncbi:MULTISPECIES: signal recognition particle-docking protein FtsY [Metallosphaera]|uniref:Signal recognition particle receptor FtsY n=1 Tax=Metallosphaera cuprina (strain Ar-4) TaxID=1006006 RepID=F4G113_METCR|nr:signal recognition particle-docking protein FtsY [Metallosphaera cuprina]AEB94703.1 signal recognition particle-docking protein FtsY [Metallosphaera cuprina Ar-4]